MSVVAARFYTEYISMHQELKFEINYNKNLGNIHTVHSNKV